MTVRIWFEFSQFLPSRLLLFGLVEQIVHLLITIAMGITFVSFGVAILFAFFKRTESIAHSIINQ